MYGNSRFEPLTRQLKTATTVVSCVGLVTGLLVVPPALNAAQPSPAQITAYGSIAGVTHLEVHLNRRQAILYQGEIPIKRYAIGTGRRGWETPVGTFRVMQMKRNPTWISPFTNERIAANDPRNPLRGYWIGFWTNGKNWVGFHGTLDKSTVGKSASHGCLHMHKRDLKELFSLVSLGTQVKVMQ